jgi:signal transduction histidine kinase/DNA-binding response OmpR family regulator
MRTKLTLIILSLKPVYNSLLSLATLLSKQSFSKANLLFLFVTLWTTLPLLAQADQNTLQVISGKQTQEITEEYTYLENTIEVFKDEKGNTSFEEVAANDALFGENNTRENFEADKVYWMKLNLLAGKHYRDTCLFFMNGFIKSWEKIDAYLIHEDGRVEQQQTGFDLAVINKSIPVDQQVIGFGLDSTENARLYIRVEGVRAGEVPYYLSLRAKQVKKLSPYLEYEYQFKGEFRNEVPWTFDAAAEIPFRFNQIRNIQLVEAPDSMTTFEDLLLHQEDWKWTDNNVNVLAKEDNVYWIKAQLIGTNFFNGEQLLQVGYYGLEFLVFNYVDIYTSKNKGDFTHQRTGNAVPLSERPYNFWATFFKVELQTADTLDLYIRLEGVNPYRRMPTLIRLFHIDASSVFPQQVHEAIANSFIGGILSIQFIFFLCLFFIERERIHFYFATFILGVFLLLFFSSDFYVCYIPFPELNKYNADLFSLGLLFFLIGLLKFTETYFNYRATSIYSKRIIPLTISVYISGYLYIFLSPSMFYFFESISTVLVVFFGLLFPFWLATRAKEQPPLLKIIWFIAMTPVILLLCSFPLFMGLDALGIRIAYANPKYLKYVPATMIFLLTSFSLSIGYRKNLLKKEKEKALEQNLKDQQIIIEKLEQTTKLEKMDEVKTRFFTNITHEFRTPLTVILGMTDQLGIGSWTAKMSGKEKDRLANGLDLIDRNGKKLLQLINQLLDLSKIDSANLKANYQLKEVVSFVQYAGESFESLAAKKLIRLQVYNEMENLTMAVDEIKLQKIISNLLSNAIKFTPTQGKVTLHLSKQNSFIQIKIKDTGEGISEEALPYIFDRFYQEDNASSRKGEGTGVGLALVQELVELMEGTISVKSELGKGAEFVILLPIHTKVTQPLAPAEEMDLTKEQANLLPTPDLVVLENNHLADTNTAITLSDNTKPHLLIAEDNPDVIFYICSILEPFYQIMTAADGAEGIDKALEYVPDLIISDVMMPVKNGLELVDTLKQDERTSHIPIVLLTAKATQQDKLDGLKFGADAYLMKPFEKEELLVRLEKLLEMRKALQRRYSKDLGGLTGANTPKTQEDLFLEKLNTVLEKHYEDSELNVKDLAQILHLSHQQFYRKLKALTDQTPNRYLRTFRLNKAKALLIADNDLNVSEIAYKMGFDNPSYFSRIFSEAFGVSPNGVRK